MLPFFAGTLLTGIFLGIGILANFLIIAPSSEKTSIPVYIIFILCSLAHNGFIYIFLLINITTFLFLLIAYKWKRYSLKNTGKAILLILFSLLLIKPVLKLLYEHDQQEERGLNFYSRQILLNKFLIDDILMLTCPLKKTSFCDQENVSAFINKKNLLFSNNPELEQECKFLFLNGIADSHIRKKYIKVKSYEIYKMLFRFNKGGSTTGTKKTHEIIDQYFHDDFVGVFNSEKFSNKIYNNSKCRIINTKLTPWSWWIILSFLILYLINLKFSVFHIDQKFIGFILFILLSILFSLLFYGIFSRAANGRYSIRIAWLIPFVGYLCLLYLVKIIIPKIRTLL